MKVELETYVDNLKLLDFKVEDQAMSSVYIVSKLDEYVENQINPHIIIALDKANLFEADAVYFRFFDDGRPPLAQLYIYDNTDNTLDDNKCAEIHRMVWSGCEIPAFMVVSRTSIKVFDSRNPVKVEKDQIVSEPIDIIEDLHTQNDILKKYKAQQFDNGSFWEGEVAQQNFLNTKAASERLVGGLKRVRNEFKQFIGDGELADRILITCILIKYLEENGKDPSTGNNLAHAFFRQATGYSTLIEIIKQNKLIDLFQSLTKHFNGGIFQFPAEWIEIILNTNLYPLAIFFEANSNNLFEWEEYSFEHIPVELISNFYEELLPREEDSGIAKDGAVYTPSFVVNLLIDECLPLSSKDEHLIENVKLIDPACGSGIFLVAAYKRLVQRWRIRNAKDGKLADTFPNILKQILKDNIFGVDIHYNSVNLSIFSLQLALCSMLTPKQIWTELGRFSNLKEDGNIIEKDFFEYLTGQGTNLNFELVVGNPPFSRKKLVNKSIEHYYNLLSEKFPVKFSNPKKEFALLFLEVSMHLLKKEKGKLCLIAPSAPILYQEDSIAFRKDFFKEYNINQIIDLTFFRRILFKATVTSLAIFAEAKKPTSDPITHIVVKRTTPSKQKLYFEFDYYDFFLIPKDIATLPYVWKCNLLGGARAYHLAELMLSINPKIGDLEKEKQIELTSSAHKKNFLSQYSLNNNNHIDTKNQQRLFFQEEENGQLQIKDSDICFWSIQKTIIPSSFPVDIQKGKFKKERTDAIELRGSKKVLLELKKYIITNKNYVSFFIAATSGRQGIRSPYVFTTSDLITFPYIDNLSQCFSESDRIIINDISKYTLEVFGQGEKAQINTQIAKYNNSLKKYASVYCDALNSIYADNDNKYHHSRLIEGDSFFICEFTFTNKNSFCKKEKTNKNIESLLMTESSSGRCKYNRIMRIYSKNIIYIIKPKQLRYWLESIALRDVDDTFDDILNQD